MLEQIYIDDGHKMLILKFVPTWSSHWLYSYDPSSRGTFQRSFRIIRRTNF